MTYWDRAPTMADLTGLTLTNADRLAVAEELQAVLPLHAFSNEEAALYILRHVATTAELDAAGRAWCGPLAERAFRLAWAAGLPARYVNLLDLGPPLETHVVPEIYYDGEWHLVDATFGIFFRRTDGPILPLHALIGDRSAPMFRTAERIWTGTARLGPVQPTHVPADWLGEFYNGMGLPGLYREMLHKARFCDAALEPMV